MLGERRAACVWRTVVDEKKEEKKKKKKRKKRRKTLCINQNIRILLTKILMSFEISDGNHTKFVNMHYVCLANNYVVNAC